MCIFIFEYVGFPKILGYILKFNVKLNNCLFFDLHFVIFHSILSFSTVIFFFSNIFTRGQIYFFSWHYCIILLVKTRTKLKIIELDSKRDAIWLFSQFYSMKSFFLNIVMFRDFMKSFLLRSKRKKNIFIQ